MTRWYKIFVIISLYGPIINVVSPYVYMCTCMIVIMLDVGVLEMKS